MNKFLATAFILVMLLVALAPRSVEAQPMVCYTCCGTDAWGQLTPMCPMRVPGYCGGGCWCPGVYGTGRAC